jgi:hypothetical protein
LLAIFGLGMWVGGMKSQSVNTTVAMAAPAPAALAVPVPNRCPNIHGALESLRSTEQELRDAAHDFCGHKRAAMETIHRAQEELRAAENCDKCR